MTDRAVCRSGCCLFLPVQCLVSLAHRKAILSVEPYRAHEKTLLRALPRGPGPQMWSTALPGGWWGLGALASLTREL